MLKYAPLESTTVRHLLARPSAASTRYPSLSICDRARRSPAKVRLVKEPLQLLVKVFAAVDQVHDNKRVGMVKGIGNAILGLASREVERVEHMERPGESLAGEGFVLKGSAGRQCCLPYLFRQLLCFFAS